MLASAEQLFSQKGFAGTSMSDIASAAEAGKGSIYWHFSSKDEILLALLEQRAEAWIAESIEAARSAEGLVAKVDAALSMVERRMRRDRDALRLLLLTLLERSAVDVRVRERVRDVYRRYRAETEREIGSMLPFVPPAQRRAIAVLVLGAFDGLFLQWQADPDDFDTEQLVYDIREGVRMLATLFDRR